MATTKQSALILIFILLTSCQEIANSMITSLFNIPRKPNNSFETTFMDFENMYKNNDVKGIYLKKGNYLVVELKQSSKEKDKYYKRLKTCKDFNTATFFVMVISYSSLVQDLENINKEIPINQQLKLEVDPEIPKSEKTYTKIESFEISKENAHPMAKKLLKEDFFWSPIEEGGPFGNDDGSDAFQDFYRWRKTNPEISPIQFLLDLIHGWGYKPFDLNEQSEEKIREYINSSELGARILYGQDNAIIAVAFGQLILEGKIDKDLNTLARFAIIRKYRLSLMNGHTDEYSKKRQEQLTIMSTVLTDQ